MRKLLLFFILTILISNFSIGQSPNYLWAKSGVGNNFDMGQAITKDVFGNVFITGSFSSSTISFGSTTLTNSGATGRDVFITKYDGNGNVLWSKQGGGIVDDMSYSIATDDSGNAYITGQFNSSSITFGSTTLTGTGDINIFIVKYDGSGNMIWAKKEGGTGDDIGYGITSDSSGNIYVTGKFNSASITFGTITLTSGSNYNIFIVKYNSSGNVIWAEGFGGTADDGGNSITTDNLGDVLVTGQFRSPSITFGTTTLTSAGNYDMFIVKCDTLGNVIWAKSGNGTATDGGTGVITDNLGNIFVSGVFQSTTITFGASILNRTGNQDLFLVKYDGNGNVLWATSSITGSGGYAQSNSCNVDSIGNVFIAGFFQSAPITLGAVTLNSVGGSDFFVAKYDGTGNPLWAKSTGGNGDDQALGIVAESNGSIFVTGFFGSTTVAFGTITLSNAGIKNIFTASLDKCYPDLPTICTVTVDSLSQYNVIAWDKTPYKNVDSFIVYREYSSNNYLPIASVSKDSLSLFIDTVRQKYFPITGDPNVTSYRYKLQIKDTCGNYSNLSLYHNTVHMVNNSGNFAWNFYEIENTTNPVTFYVLMRDNFNNGNWITVAGVSGSQNSITDPQYSTWAATANWRIETQWNITCTPTIKLPEPMGTIKTTKSNTFKTVAPGAVNGIGLENSVSIYPNPSKGTFTIDLKDSNSKPVCIKMYDVFGRVVHEQTTSEKKVVINGELAKGIYQLQIETILGSIHRALVIQ